MHLKCWLGRFVVFQKLSTCIFMTFTLQFQFMEKGQIQAILNGLVYIVRVVYPDFIFFKYIAVSKNMVVWKMSFYKDNTRNSGFWCLWSIRRNNIQRPKTREWSRCWIKYSRYCIVQELRFAKFNIFEFDQTTSIAGLTIHGGEPRDRYKRRTIKLQCFPLYSVLKALGNPTVHYLR